MHACMHETRMQYGNARVPHIGTECITIDTTNLLEGKGIRYKSIGNQELIRRVFCLFCDPKPLAKRVHDYPTDVSCQ